MSADNVENWPTQTVCLWAANAAQQTSLIKHDECLFPTHCGHSGQGFARFTAKND